MGFKALTITYSQRESKQMSEQTHQHVELKQKCGEMTSLINSDTLHSSVCFISVFKNAAQDLQNWFHDP
jgi:hypothetical protein